MPTAPTLPPNPSLLALFLIIRTKSGPRLVFNYPSHPTLTPPKSAWHFESSHAANSDSSSSSSDDDTATVASSSSDNKDVESGDRGSSGEAGNSSTGARTTGTSASRRAARTLREEGPDDDDEDEVPELSLGASLHAFGSGRERSGSGEDSKGRQRGLEFRDRDAPVEWEKVLGYSTDGLEKLLSPGRDLRKKRFEVMLDEVVFLGYPVFVREDGAWRKKKASGRSTRKDGHVQGSGKSEQDDKTRVGTPEHSGIKINGSNKDGGERENGSLGNSFQSQGAMSEAHSEAKSTSTSSGDSSDQMTMFHVVFVMNPPALEYHVRVEEMYDNVVKKLAKALKYEQASSGYVWNEAKKMLAMRSHAKENHKPASVLWSSLMQESSLAKSLAHVFTSISSSKIAHIPISKTVDASLQIPQAISTPYAPTPAEPQMPGLWLTTATMIDDDESDTSLSPHAALLLLEDKETLLKEIESDNRELAAPLAYFIRELSPTKSLHKLATRLSLRLPDLQFLARHLIYWRRARAIPPLHIRDTYIVSPNADMRHLSSATETFDRKFPGLPSLPRMLQSLSTRPVQYGYLIPSQDHKEAYMDILAWLLRRGWVTQLRTFAWVKVAPEVKAKVAAQMRREDLKSAKDKAAKRMSTASESASSGLLRRVITEEDKDSDPSQSRANSIADLLSPALKPVSSDAESVSSSRTAMQVGSAKPSPALRPSPLAVPLSPFGIDSTADTTSTVPPLDLTDYEQSLVLSPHKATAEESRWLKCIGESLSDPELVENWTMLYRYFDGQWALEGIAAREGLKRSKVASLLTRLEKEGVLCIVRHW